MATWNAAFDTSPAGGTSPSLGDDRIREERAAISYRMSNEHDTYRDATTGDPDLDWTHKPGSAKALLSDTEPTTRPNGITALDADDDGRLFVDTTDSGHLLKVYSDAEGGYQEVGAPHGKQKFVASGSFVVPGGVTTIRISGCAAGGNGGDAVALPGQFCGGGGGGGEWALEEEFTVTPGDTLTVTIGGHGEDTSIDTFTLHCGEDGTSPSGGAGGSGGNGHAGGLGGYGGDNSGTSGQPGLAAGGGGGSSFMGVSSTYYGGGSGGGGGSYTPGAPGVNYPTNDPSANHNVIAGSNAGYGGGGSGGGWGYSSSTHYTEAGGAGGPALLIVEW